MFFNIITEASKDNSSAKISITVSFNNLITLVRAYI